MSSKTSSSSEPTLVRIGKQGEVALPDDMRQHLGVGEGDLVAAVETPEGILITTREGLVTWLLDGLGASLREQGVTLEEWIESGRAERATIIREMYGFDVSDEA